MTRRHPAVRFLGLCSLLALVPIAAIRIQGQAGQSAAAGRLVALSGGTVLTVTKARFQTARSCCADGKIAAVGANVTIPAGAEIIDTTGQFVSPGIIDAHSHIAERRDQRGRHDGQLDDRHGGRARSDRHQHLPRARGRRHRANVLHGSANPIGGKNQVIKLRWGKTRAEEIVLRGRDAGDQVRARRKPEGHADSAAPDRPAPLPDDAHGRRVRDPRRVHAREGVSEGVEGLRAEARPSPDAIPPRRDLQLEPLVEILEGNRLVHAHCYRADEILMLIRLADEMGFKIATFQHVLEGYKVAKEIAAHGAGGSTFSDWWALQGRSGRRDSVQRRDHDAQGRRSSRSTPTAPSTRAG